MYYNLNVGDRVYGKNKKWDIKSRKFIGSQILYECIAEDGEKVITTCETAMKDLNI